MFFFLNLILFGKQGREEFLFLPKIQFEKPTEKYTSAISHQGCQMV